MTGYVFAKICKYKEIDSLFIKNKMADKKKMYQRKKKQTDRSDANDTEASTQDESSWSTTPTPLQKPASLKNTQLNYMTDQFSR